MARVLSLDESETPLKHDTRRFRFRGILKIADPNWLSDFGLKTVETELNLRAHERALREGERAPPPLTLEGLFQSRLLTPSCDATWRKEDEAKLTVLVQGEKSYPAVYMRCELSRGAVREGIPTGVQRRSYPTDCCGCRKPSACANGSLSGEVC